MASNTNYRAENRIASRSQRENLPDRNSKKSGFDISGVIKKAKNLVFLIAVAYLVFSLISQQGVISKNSAEIATLEQQISEKQVEIEQLEKEYSDVYSDEYVERMAREKLGLVQPNERVFKDSSKRQ